MPKRCAPWRGRRLSRSGLELRCAGGLLGQLECVSDRWLRRHRQRVHGRLLQRHGHVPQHLHTGRRMQHGQPLRGRSHGLRDGHASLLAGRSWQRGRRLSHGRRPLRCQRCLQRHEHGLHGCARGGHGCLSRRSSGWMRRRREVQRHGSDVSNGCILTRDHDLSRGRRRWMRPPRDVHRNDGRMSGRSLRSRVPGLSRQRWILRCRRELLGHRRGVSDEWFPAIEPSMPNFRRRLRCSGVMHRKRRGVSHGRFPHFRHGVPREHGVL